MGWLRRYWLSVVLISILIIITLGVILQNSYELTQQKREEISLEATKKERQDVSTAENNKILTSNIEELSNEDICINIGFLLSSYCGSGGCFMNQPLEAWIGRAKSVLHSRGVSAYENYKDSGKDIDCSDSVLRRVDRIYGY